MITAAIISDPEVLFSRGVSAGMLGVSFSAEGRVSVDGLIFI